MIFYWHDASTSKPEPGEEVLAAYFVQDKNDEISAFCLDKSVFWFPKGTKVAVKPMAKTTSAFIKEPEKVYQFLDEDGWYMLDLVNGSGYLLYRKVKDPMFWTQILMPDVKSLGPVEWLKEA